MDKNDKILAKIGKLLTRYGVSDEEKENYINDLVEMKDDEEEETETTENDEVVEEEPKPEEKAEGEDEATPTDENEVETPADDPQEEPPVVEEEVTEEGEEVNADENPEEPAEEPKEEVPNADFNAQIEELKKANEGLVARLESLEQLVAQLGTPKEEGQFGATPEVKPIDEPKNSFMEELNRKRMG